MARTLEELWEKRPPNWEAVAKEKERLLARQQAYQLNELRRRNGLTQKAVAKLMRVGQNRVSQIESSGAERTRLDTLRRYAEALGGELQVTINLGDESIRIA
ncbi:MAG: helix-turn-helix domain-containing protein [Promicromonosporaceae bacterium]|nr:helix-turn-helix domain-containing protein [Promicromonosporaceae bacterium]